MKSGKWVTHATLAAVSLCSGCAVPRYDVPYDQTSGQPTVSSIVERVECELTDMVRAPLPGTPGIASPPPVSGAEWFLLNGDYDVVVTLSLEVNDTGALTPSVMFMEPVSTLISFMIGGSATLSESRDHTFTDNLQLSMRQLYADAQMARDPSLAPDRALANHPKARAEFAHHCPEADTNLSRTLEIKDLVAMGAQMQRLPPKTATQAFGGAIAFVVTKNISGVGPTWTTTRWKGPGGLVGLSHVNTDKITLSFAEGPNAGYKLPLQVFAQIPLSAVRPNGPNARAYNFLQQQLTQSINSQLQTLVNPVP